MKSVFVRMIDEIKHRFVLVVDRRAYNTGWLVQHEVKPLDSNLDDFVIDLNAIESRHLRPQLQILFTVNADLPSNDFTSRSSFADAQFLGDEMIESQLIISANLAQNLAQTLGLFRIRIDEVVGLARIGFEIEQLGFFLPNIQFPLSIANSEIAAS